ncbi:hypothetical protein TNCV_4945941 [Trichonephila clavipes]|nr:hypothetical protein TNCV_4945941 [Trichonephila clavipes]
MEEENAASLRFAIEARVALALVDRRIVLQVAAVSQANSAAMLRKHKILLMFLYPLDVTHPVTHQLDSSRLHA